MTAREWATIYETDGKEKAFQIIADIAKPFERFGVRPSLMLGQFLQESYKGNGKWSALFLNQNNLHGIKSDDGAVCPTQEEIDGQLVDVNDRFGIYNDIDAGIEAYCRLMCGSRYFDVRAASTWQGAVRALGTSGYATDSNYAKAVRNWIETYELGKYDTYEFSDRKAQVFNTTKYGDRGQRVEGVQRMLQGIVEVTGIYDLTTYDAIKDFQKQSGLEIDGVCGINTYLALENKTIKEPIEEAIEAEKDVKDSVWVRFLKIEGKTKKRK